MAPAVESWLGDDDLVSLFAAADGSATDTMTLALLTFDFETGGTKTLDLEIADIPTFSAPFDTFAETDVAIDVQDRIAGVYTEVPAGEPPKVKLALWDGLTGDLTDLLEVNDGSDAEIAVALPNGDTLFIPSVPQDGSGIIQGNLVDRSGGTPVVLPEFPISTAPAPVGNDRPAVATDPVTGNTTVVWDFVTGFAGNPSDIRARRFDGQGNPVGDDFQVNVHPLIGDDNSQGQAAVAYGPGGLSAIVWATDGTTGDPDTDIAGRAFLPNGTPIGPILFSQFPVNTGNPPGGPLSDRQDEPTVRFLPNPDSQGRPQFAVLWRDVGDGTGADPNGSGASYRCFAIEGLDEQVPIFEDGFESGNTLSWSDSNPP